MKCEEENFRYRQTKQHQPFGGICAVAVSVFFSESILQVIGSLPGTVTATGTVTASDPGNGEKPMAR